MAEQTLLVVLGEAGEVAPVVRELFAAGTWNVLYAKDVREARRHIASTSFLTHILCDMALSDGYGHVLHQEARERHPHVRFVVLRRAVADRAVEEVRRYYAAHAVPVCDRPLRPRDVLTALTA